MAHEPIQSASAPKAVGTYSQAIKAGTSVYLSGQIPIDPVTGKLIHGDFEAQISRVLDNLDAVVREAGGSLAEIVKLNVYLTDLAHYAAVNAVMAKYFSAPYPARAVIEVSALPLGAPVEIDGILVLDLSEYSY